MTRGTNRRLIVEVQQRGGVDRSAAIERRVRSILGQLVSTRLLNTLRITVKMRARLSIDNARGACHWRDLVKATSARSKHYTIEILRDLGDAQMLRTLAHELRHVEQMARGRLACRTYGGQVFYFWRAGAGRAARWPLDTPWSQRPWEIEARASEGLR